MTGTGARRRRDAVRGQLGAIQDSLRAANLILEVRDARAPRSSSATRLLGRAAGKRRGVVLAKADLADPTATKAWLAALEAAGTPAVALDMTGSGGGGRNRGGSRRGRGRSGNAGAQLTSFIARIAGNRRSALGVTRVAVVGLPNVGKSTLINRLQGRAMAVTGDRPGVTRGKQWIRVADDIVVLDTPGVIQLFDGIERRLGEDFFKLVMCNIVPAGQYDDVAVAEAFLAWVRATYGRWPCREYHGAAFDRLWSPVASEDDGGRDDGGRDDGGRDDGGRDDGERRDGGRHDGVEATLLALAEAAGLRASGGTHDYAAAARRLMTDWRHGKLGVWTLDDVGEGEVV